jgi:polyhydroxyalkanoate synthesis regulator phasin
MRANTYALAVNGQVWTTAGVLITSDETLKRNIKNMEEQRSYFVNNLSLLKSKTYEKLVESGKDNEAEINAMVAAGKIPAEEAASALQELNERKKDTYKFEYGFIAQDVKELFPELVQADENGLLAINYTGLIPVLLEAIKDLQDKVEKLEQRNSDDDVTIRNSGNSENTEITVNSDFLSQNVPNPVDGSTVIKYSLPDGATLASIVIYSNNGSVVKIIPLDANTKSGSITLYASDLAKGINIYNLTANGVLLGSKRIINP